MKPTTNAARHITIELPTRIANLLTASSIHEGTNVGDYMVAAAVTAARTLVDNDLARRRTGPRWQFIDERWLRRHGGRIDRYLRRGHHFIVTLHGEPVGYLLHPTAGAANPLSAPNPRRKWRR